MKLLRHSALLTSLLLAAYAAAPAQKVFNGCPLHGDAVQTDNKRLNAQKNRYDLPARGTRYHRIRLEDVLLRGPDENRFPVGVPAEMVGFVRLVKRGSKETCNCKATSPELTDTHIELVPGEGNVLNHPRRAVVVEVTPRIREMVRAEGKEWDTNTLKGEIEGRWVRVRGWLLYDHEHTENADATNPSGRRVYKGGNWEIHPITDIKVLPGPPADPAGPPIDTLTVRESPADPTAADEDSSEVLEPVITPRRSGRRRPR